MDTELEYYDFIEIIRLMKIDKMFLQGTLLETRK